MKSKYTILITILIAVLLFCGACLITASGEVTQEDVDITLYNSGVALVGAQYEKETIGEIDYFEFDYIDGMNVTLSASFNSSLGTYTGVEIRRNGSLFNNINSVGIYELVVTVRYTEGGLPKVVDKNVTITVNKVDLAIIFSVVSKKYMDSTEGAQANYTDKPASVSDSSISYTYYQDELLTLPLDGAPTEVGSYYVKAFYDDDSNLNYQGEATSAFTILKSDATISAQNGTVVYNGEEVNLETTLLSAINGDCAANYVAEMYLEGIWTDAEIINAGAYIVRFHFEGGDGNFNNPYSEEYALTINKADTEFIVDTISLEYSGEAVDLTINYNNQIKLYNADYDTEIAIPEEVADIEYFTDLSEPILAPTEIGEYKYHITFAGNDNLNSTQSELMAFSINKKEIVIDILGDYNALTHTLITDYTGNDIEVSYSITDTESNPIAEAIENETITYYRVITETYMEELSALPVLPDDYSVEIEVSTEHYYGNLQIFLVVEKLDFSDNFIIKYNDASFLSGESVAYTAYPIIFDISNDTSYNIDGYSYEYEGITPTAYSRTSVAPQHAGNYRMYIEIDDDIYKGSYNFDFSISKLTITVKPNDITTAYGNRIYLVSGNLIYQAQDVTVNGLADGDTASSITNYISIHIGEDELTQVDSSIVVGTYSLKTALRTDITHPSYIIDVAGSDTGMLTVTKRDLFVTMNDLIINIGSAATPTFSEPVGFAYNDSADTDLRNAIQWDYYDSEELLDAVPDVAGTYRIVAKGQLDNYNINSVDGDLILCLEQLNEDNSLPITILGKFTPGQSFEIQYTSANDDMKRAVTNKLPKYKTVRVYTVMQKAESADNSGMIIQIDLSGIDISDNFKILAKYDNAYTELDFSQNGNILEISEITMADAYILCDEDKIDFMWYIFGGSILLIVGLIIGVILRIYLTGGFKKKDKSEVKAVVASGKINKEDEELEELLKNFDESSVVREMTPAEKLEQKRKEEKYEQYRLKLQRLRAAGDKTLEDSLIKSGVKHFDDEMLIERMIKEDEERALRLEEEARLEREAEEKEKEKPKAIILPKNTQNYEQKSFAPKAKEEDEFDIDI